MSISSVQYTDFYVIPTFNVNDEKMFTAKRHFDGVADKETGPRIPKIQALLDEIINDTPDDVDVASQTSLPTAAVKQNSSSDVIPRVIPQQTLPNPFPSIVTPKPSAEVIAEVFPSVPMKNLPTTNYQLPPPHIVDEVFPQAVKTKP